MALRKISQRDFSGEADLQAMMSLARAFPAENLHRVDLPYRLSSWALDDPGNVGLWDNAEGQLLGWAVLQTPFWTMDYAYDPFADPGLHREILAWVDARARSLLGTPYGHPCWFVNVFASQVERSRDLERAGFASQADVGEDAWSKVLLERPARLPVPDGTLPQGFSLRPLAGEREVEAYVRLQRAVFETENMTSAWRLSTLRRPEYRADLDLVAVAPDGSLAAFCVCWFDESSRAGQVEPLGVHKDFRAMGLGRAILSEGLYRLHLCGAERVYVETDRYRDAALELYESAGFRPARDVLVYRKDYGDTPG